MKWKDRPDNDDESEDRQRGLGGVAEAMRRAVESGEQPEAPWETLFAQYADSDHRGLLVIGQGRMVVALNPVARSLLLYDGPTPSPVSEIVHDISFGFAVGDVFHDAREATYEAYIPSPDRLLRFDLLPIIERRVTVAAVVCVEDVTRLRQLETVRRDFVANVSHELRTPIASITLLTETLQNGALDDPEAAHHFLDRIQVETKAMARLVEELLELSRLESATLHLEAERLSVSGALRGLMHRMAPLAQEKAIELQLDVQADLPPVTADPKRIEQVLMNLVHNAVKFTPAHGEVILRARRQGRGIEIEVVDTGVGMERGEAIRVFERFYKTDRGRDRADGAGLGLAIARHLVELHGSRLQVVSAPGRGSRFSFTLPLAD
ncbi:MAG TPA: ATP-binding protein [Chloroflexota bacterium]|nr:ATP-binding protein [Chloroflexota bacterium]